MYFASKSTVALYTQCSNPGLIKFGHGTKYCCVITYTALPGRCLIVQKGRAGCFPSAAFLQRTGSTDEWYVSLSLCESSTALHYITAMSCTLHKNNLQDKSLVRAQTRLSDLQFKVSLLCLFLFLHASISNYGFSATCQ